MSFSGEIKEELSTLVPAAHHCRLAETAAIFQKFGGSGFIYHEDYANTIPEANGKRVIKLSQKRGA